jgi:glycosyltransferase involved in cell wall biosynthesis
MRPPLVSMIVGCYNHAPFAEHCLESVRRQTFRDSELIIVDDCSSDGSANVIRKWIATHGVQCQFLAHSKNLGVCKSFNNAIGQARGKYISIISADDEWLPDKLETQVVLMEAFPPTAGVLYSDAYQIDENGRILPEMFIESHRQFASPPEGYIADVLWQGNFIPAMTTLIRRTCYDAVGLYDESLAIEDWDMWLRISEQFSFHFSSYISARYRILASSLSRSRRDAVEESSARIARKFLAQGRLESQSCAEATKILLNYAQDLYQRNDPRRLKYLIWAFRNQRSARLGLKCVLSACGIPASVVPKLRRIFKGG